MKPNNNPAKAEPEKAELVSALADDHLVGRERREALSALDEHDQLRERWQRYHLIGDLMRGEATPAPKPEPAFDLAARVRVELESEPHHLMPRRRVTPTTVGWAMAASGVLAAVLLMATKPFDETASAPLLAKVEPPRPANVVVVRSSGPVQGEWERLDPRELAPYLVNHHAHSTGLAVPASVRIFSEGAR